MHRHPIDVIYLEYAKAKCGLRLCPVWPFHSSTYILSDAWLRKSRQQVQFLYISLFETSRHCLTCTIAR